MLRLIDSSSVTLLGGALDHIFSLFYFLVKFRLFGDRSASAFLVFSFSRRRMPFATDICFRCAKRGHRSSSCGRIHEGFGSKSQMFKGEKSTHHSGINPVNQSSHDTAGVFEDIIKVDDMFSPTHELESGTLDPDSIPLSVKGRLKAHVRFGERINATPFIIECIRELQDTFLPYSLNSRI